MTARRRRRPAAMTTNDKIRAIFSDPTLYELGALIPERQPIGRRSHFPGYLLLGYGVLARLFRSAARVETEIADPATWEVITQTIRNMHQRDPELVPRLPGPKPPNRDAFRYARDAHLTSDDVLPQLQALFTECAVDRAREFGLLNPNGPGSLSHPDRSRVVYGDGTVVRPLYRPPAATRTTTKDGETVITYTGPGGAPQQAPTRRYDPDAADYHGHAGPVHGQNFVALYARGDHPGHRVVLAVARVDRPGHEAATAVTAIKALHEIAGNGIQAVVYDGAMRGAHIDDLMTTLGVVVINKVHSSAKTATRRGKKSATPRYYPLGAWEHDTSHTPGGSTTCTHQLGAVDGAVSEIALNEVGKAVILHRLERRQIKRPRRASGRYHFNVAYEVPCPQEPFTAWITPHALASETSHTRADAVRIIAEGEPDFDRLYGLRNDAESFNSEFKRTLIVDRAMSLGARRQLLDVLCYAILHNAINAARAQASAPNIAVMRRVAPGARALPEAA